MISTDKAQEMQDRRDFLESNKHLTPRQAAEHIGIEPQTLRAWAKKEGIKMYDPRRSSLWRQNPLDEDRAYIIKQFTGTKDAITLAGYLGCSLEAVREFVVKHNIECDIESTYRKKTRRELEDAKRNPLMDALLSSKRLGMGL